MLDITLIVAHVNVNKVYTAVKFHGKPIFGYKRVTLPAIFALRSAIEHDTSPKVVMSFLMEILLPTKFSHLFR